MRQATELALGSINRAIGFPCVGNWRPLQIHFTHGPPRSRRFHRQFFGCEVVFHSDFDGIVCAASDLQRRIPTASPEFARFLEGRIAVFEEQLERWDARVALLIRTLLPGEAVRSSASPSIPVVIVAPFIAGWRNAVRRSPKFSTMNGPRSRRAWSPNARVRWPRSPRWSVFRTERDGTLVS
jgi:hypothetical protein